MAWQQSVLFTLACVTALVFVEIALAAVLRRHVYSLAGTLTNISAYSVYLPIAAVYGYAEFLLFSYLQLAFDIPKLKVNLLYWIALVLADDFCYYWFHRMSHRLGILWMSHVVHHSSHEFNLAVGLRQTWLPFLGIIFWLPLAVAGFRIEHILLVQALSLGYQFLMHTQLIDLPRFFGWLFNTPSHHRVHHGMNAEYIDRNFAGVFIVWDKLFGTFAPERNAVHFGIQQPSPRGEIVFVQLWGPWQFVKNLLFARRVSQATDSGPNGAEIIYARQKSSSLLAAFFLVASSVLLALALANPRWFL